MVGDVVGDGVVGAGVGLARAKRAVNREKRVNLVMSWGVDIYVNLGERTSGRRNDKTRFLSVIGRKHL